MKKCLSLLLVIIMVVSFMKVNNDTKAVEYNLYPMNCNAFEVSTFSSNGFNKVECFNDFNSAKNKLRTLGDDGVIRHYASYSPSKIIAMNSGMAVTYGVRKNSPTTNIYQFEDFNVLSKSTYVIKHRTLDYIDTTVYNNGLGKVNVHANGFDGYVDLKEVDLVPMKAITDEIPIYLGGNDITKENEQPFLTRIYQPYYEAVQNGNYRDLVFHAYSGWSKNGRPSEYKMYIGKAFDFMENNKKYYSHNGYDFYSDRYYKDKVATEYNYYQFLPFRTKSKINVNSYNKLLSLKNISSDSKLYNKGQVFIDGQNKYGVNAALTFSMAALESGYGTSYYAMQRNNLFGWSAYDSNPDNATYFNTIDQAIFEHMGINLRGYMDIVDFRFFGLHLGNKGSGFNVKYAADPYWGAKIASIAYELDKVDNNYNGNLTDYNSERLALINTYNASVYSDINHNKELYKTAYGSTYQNNFIVNILEDNNEYVKIQSANAIRPDGSLLLHTVNKKISPLEDYDFNRSVGFINNKELTPLNTNIITTEGTYSTGEYVFNVNELTIDNGKLYIEGNSYMPGIYINDENKMSLKLEIINDRFEKTIKDLKVIVNDKDKASFICELDLSEIAVGKYYFVISSEYSKYGDNNRSNTIDISNVKNSSTTNREYNIIKDSGYYWLDIREVKEVVNDDNVYLLQNLVAFEYLDEEKTKIRLEGRAFFNGMDAKDDSDIEVKIFLRNMETNDDIYFDTSLSSLNTPIKLNDDKVYKKVVFESILDLSTIKEGDYTINIYLRNNKKEYSSNIRSVNTKFLLEKTMINDLTYEINEKQRSSYRIELSVYKYGIDKSLINKPSRTDSFINSQKVEIKDGILNIKGYTWVYLLDYPKDKDYDLKLVFLSKDDGTLKSFDIKPKNSDLDLNSLLKLGFDLTNVKFDESIDISSLEKGEYLIFFDSSSNNSRDIYEYYNIYKPNIESSTYNGKTYSLKFMETRSRLELTIK